jgi:glycosyltransferase involved in cell wall biosynthesis
VTLFIGPIGELGGPAIKNRILIKYLNSNSEIRVCNTHNRKLSNFLKTALALIFSKENQIIVSVSRKGRFVLYPILLVKKLLNVKLKYATICIGGTIVEDAIEHPYIITNALRRSDLIFVETKMLKNKVEDQLALKNVYYMPNYKEIDNNGSRMTRKKSERYDSNLKFVFLSSIRNVKGVATMIYAFNKIINKYPQAILDIYGPIRDDFDIKILEDIKENTNINYKGLVNNNEVIEKLSVYDVFIFPTEYTGEGFPAVLIEAYLAGLVVVASDMNYNTEIVREGINGWVFPSGDEEKLVQALSNCFNNLDKLNDISKCNIEEAQKYDAKKVIDKFRNDLIKQGWEI